MTEKKKILIVADDIRIETVLEFIGGQKEWEIAGLTSASMAQSQRENLQKREIRICEDYKLRLSEGDIDAVLDLTRDEKVKRYLADSGSKAEVIGKLTYDMFLKLLREKKARSELENLSAKIDPSTGLEENLVVLVSVAMKVLKARAAAGLTQAEVAARIGTTQSAVARLEAAVGKHSPSIATLKRYASALGYRLQVRLVKDQGLTTRSTRTRAKTAHAG